MSTKNSSNNAGEEVDEDAYYSDDEEVKIGRVEYRAVIMHTDNGVNTSGLGQFLATETPYCCLYIMFEVIQGWKSSLQVRVVMKEKGADDKIIIIRLGCNTIQDRNVTAELLPPGHLPSSIRHIAKMQQANNEGHIYRVNVSFNPIGVLSDRLWVNLAGAIKLNSTLRKLREIFISSTLELYVRSSTGITKSIEEFLDIIQQERVVNPLNAWHPAHPDRHFVQLGQTASAKERPAIKLPPQTSFLTVAEWATVMGYGAIAEQEVAADRAADIEGSIFALQAITIPGGGERRYMALIDGLEEMPLRFDPEEALSVNFNAEVDDREKD